MINFAPLLAATLAAGAPLPQSATPSSNLTNQAPPPAPALDISPFRFLVGRWHGKGKFAFTGKTVTSTMTFEVESRTTIIVRAAEDRPNTYRYAATWSLEKGSGELVMLMSSSLDGPALLRSDGWTGDRLVFEPRPGLNTGASSVRFTYLKRSDAIFELTYEFNAGGKWVAGDKQIFRKVASP